MVIIALTQSNYDEAMAQAVSILKTGGIIAYPTESFYALGALALNEQAVRKVFDIKKRTYEKPLPLIVNDMQTLQSVAAEIPDNSRDLISKFWPGPLTIIFKARQDVPALLTGSSGKVAVRVPGESAALRLAEHAKMALTATSANISSQPAAITAESVSSYFGNNIDLILDGGEAPGGKPSTILDVTVKPPQILRQGSIDQYLILETNKN